MSVLSDTHLGTYLIVSDPDTTVLHVDDRYAEVMGLHPSEMIGLRWLDRLGSLARKEAERALAACTPEHAAFMTESHERRPDGTVGWVRWIHQVHFEQGEMVRIHSRGTDVTAEKWESHRHREFLDVVPDLFLRIDRGHRFRDYHVGRGGSLMRPPEFFLGKTLEEVMPPDVAAGAAAAVDRVLRTGKSTTFEYSLRQESGSRWYESRIFPDEEDMVLVVVRDSTAQHAMLKALERARHDYETIFQGTDEGMFLITVERDGFRFQRTNPALLRRTGFERSDLEKKRLEAALPPDIAELGRIRLSECVETRSRIQFSAELDVPAGRRTWHITLTPVFEGDTVRNIIGSALDVTEQVAALREKTILLAEIHHRVKNNLAIVDSLLELKKDHVDSPDIREALQESQFRIKTMALIHEKLYQNESFSCIAFDGYIRELGAHIHRAQGPAGGRVRLSYDTDRLELPMTGSVPAALAYNEILNNAFKHAFRTDGSGDIRVGLKVDGRLVRLTVADDGPGYDPDAGGDGDGLGITLIRTLTEQLGGTVRWITQEGTRVELVFPLP